jgi:hypothetical protein
MITFQQRIKIDSDVTIVELKDAIHKLILQAQSRLKGFKNGEIGRNEKEKNNITLESNEYIFNFYLNGKVENIVAQLKVTVTKI